jgi:hypothetical protein
MHITKSAVAVGVVSVGPAGLLSACGDSGGSTASAAHQTRSAPSHIYRVTLTPPCWRSAHLHGFTGARSAAILASGTVIHLSTSTKLHHQECRRLTAGVLAAIAQHPGRFTVTIPTAADPKGAVSARL